MKKLGSIFTSIFMVLFLTSTNISAQSTDLKWYTWEEAMELNKVSPKKMLVDVYTDWCGWCKKMDSSTFKDPNIMKYLSEHFYAVKFNAEQEEDIVFQENTFKFVPGSRRGTHQLAQALLDGRMGYPSIVLLDESSARIMISPGFKQADQLMTELTFAKEEKYKEMSFDQFKANTSAGQE